MHSVAFKNILLFLPLRGASEAMARDRKNSWDSCLCHGPMEAFAAAFPEEVQSSVVVPFDMFHASICPKYIASKNCNIRTNCLYMHPDFINNHRVVPSDLPQVVPRCLRLPTKLLEPAWV